MSFLVINVNIKGNCGGDFSRQVKALWAIEIATTKAEQEALV
ncbi:MAG: hypothetical protein ACXWTY_11560 [Methylobacter sp.]